MNCFGAVSLFCLIRNNPPLYPLALFSLRSFVLSCVLGSTKDRMPHVVLFEVKFWQLKDYIRGILFTQGFIPIIQPAYLFPLARGPWCPITESFAVTGNGFPAPSLRFYCQERMMGTHFQWRQTLTSSEDRSYNMFWWAYKTNICWWLKTYTTEHGSWLVNIVFLFCSVVWYVVLRADCVFEEANPSA